MSNVARATWRCTVAGCAQAATPALAGTGHAAWLAASAHFQRHVTGETAPRVVAAPSWRELAAAA